MNICNTGKSHIAKPLDNAARGLAGFALCAAAVIVSACAGRPALTPSQLKCESLTDPSAIDSRVPRLSWVNIGRGNGQVQTAYEIRAASSRELLRSADLWSTGRVESDESLYIPYGGKELRSAQDCWWQVRVWDRDGRVSRWSAPAHWGMGLLDPDDWEAEWIGAPWEGEAVLEQDSPAPMLRKTFSVKGKPVSAKAFVCGLGLMELYINGAKVSDDVLVPNESSYTSRPGLDSIGLTAHNLKEYRVYYMGYDILPLLRDGDNAVGVMLGSGYFASWRSEFATSPYGTPRLICQLELKWADGSEETVVSDCSWRVRKSPIVVSDLFYGEVYDAREEIPLWASPDYVEDGSWTDAVPRKAPDGKLCAPAGPPDKVAEILKPHSIIRLEDGSWEVDFDDYVTGWVRLKLPDIPAGDSVIVTHLPDERFSGTSIYIGDGKGPRIYAPRFAWNTFERVIIKGWPQGRELRKGDLVAEVVHSDVERTGRFSCSNPLFNRINDIWCRTQTDNMHMGVPTDCPHREKGPYTGDGQVVCATVMDNFGAQTFYNKWMRDISDVQDSVSGHVPNGAPWHPRCGGGVGWGAAMCIVPWEHWLHYGDIEALRTYWSAMSAWVEFLYGWKREDGVIETDLPTEESGLKTPWRTEWLNLGDWVTPDGKYPPKSLVHTWFLWKCATINADAASVLGMDVQERHFRDMAEEVREAFNRVFYDAEGGSYGGHGGNIFALAMGVPEDRREAVRAAVREEFRQSGGHVYTGIFGTRLLFETLTAEGMGDLAYAAMDKRDAPSFGWWVEQGSHTMWECWDDNGYTSVPSFVHPMFGGGLTWLYKDVAGMRIDPAEPGYKHIIFKPVAWPDLSWAEYSTATPYGQAGIRWDVSPDGVMTCKVDVPVGSRATLWLPGREAPEEIAAGRYTFKAEMQPPGEDM